MFLIVRKLSYICGPPGKWESQSSVSRSSLLFSLQWDPWSHQWWSCSEGFGTCSWKCPTKSRFFAWTQSNTSPFPAGCLSQGETRVSEGCLLHPWHPHWSADGLERAFPLSLQWGTFPPLRAHHAAGAVWWGRPRPGKSALINLFVSGLHALKNGFQSALGPPESVSQIPFECCPLIIIKELWVLCLSNPALCQSTETVDLALKQLNKDFLLSKKNERIN